MAKMYSPYQVDGEKLYNLIYVDFQKQNAQPNFIKYVRENLYICKQTLDKIKSKNAIESKKTFAKLSTNSLVKSLLAKYIDEEGKSQK